MKILFVGLHTLFVVLNKMKIIFSHYNYPKRFLGMTMVVKYNYNELSWKILTVTIQLTITRG